MKKRSRSEKNEPKYPFKGSRETRFRKERFIEAYAKCLSVSLASRDLGIGRRTIYNWKEEDENFASAMLDAELDALERIQYEAVRQAIKGDKTMIMFLLNNKGAKLGFNNGHIRESELMAKAKAASYLATRFIEEIDKSIEGEEEV